MQINRCDANDADDGQTLSLVEYASLLKAFSGYFDHSMANTSTETTPALRREIIRLLLEVQVTQSTHSP